ncbi:MAG TPA: hypothetical protein VM942_10385 [Acidimicrobiales bacterium]|nr:hypothetical protein [Acidimicrobiales bacterium]
MTGVPLPDEIVVDLEERVRLAVAGGYDSGDEIVEGMVELVEYDPPTEEIVAENRDEVVDAIQRMVDRRLAEHAVAERGFPPTTDCDRLTGAFTRLDAVGVVAREDVGYTQSDLRDEMWELVDRAGSEGREARGWTAFHRQDVERVVDSGVLWVSFASVSDDDEGFRTIGAEVATALADAGLTVAWNGDPNRRIELVGMRWQKRRRR